MPAIPQLARAGSLPAVNIFRGDDLRNVGQAGEDAFAARVAQAAFDAVLFSSIRLHSLENSFKLLRETALVQWDEIGG